MREKTKAYLRRFIIAAFFLVFLMIGNLLAARSMTSYAAQVHPDWTPEDGWASYNLVDNGYDLSFTDGAQSHSLGYANGVVQDKEREEALREEL